MIDIAFCYYLLVTNLNIEEKWNKYLDAISIALAIFLCMQLDLDNEYIAMALGAILLLQTIFVKKIPLMISRAFLPLIILSVASLELGLVYAVLVIVFENNLNSNQKTKNIIALSCAIMMTNVYKIESSEMALVVLVLSSLMIWQNYRSKKYIQVLLWCVLQGQVISQITSYKIVIFLKIFILIYIFLKTIQVWFEHKNDRVWQTFKYTQVQFIAFATLHMGLQGFWGALVFYVLVKDVFSVKNTDDQNAIIKIKPYGLSTLFLLPISLPVYFLFNQSTPVNIMISFIITSVFMSITWRWLRVMRETINEKYIDKWQALNLSTLACVTVFCAYRQVGDNITSVAGYSLLSLLSFVLFVMIRMDDKILSIKFVPKYLLYSWKIAEPESIMTLPDYRGKYLHNLSQFMKINLAVLFEWLEANFLVAYLIIFSLVFFIGGGFG